MISINLGIILYPLSSNIPIPVNSYSPYNLCSFKYHTTFYLLSCNATTSQCYAINNTRTCVEYVLILDYFVINYILLWCRHATSQHKSYGYQKLANLCVIILFNIYSFLILPEKESYQLLLCRHYLLLFQSRKYICSYTNVV